MRAVEARDDRAGLVGPLLERLGHELLHVSHGLLARRAALDGTREPVAGLADDVIRRDALADEELLVSPGLDRRLRREDDGRRPALRLELPRDEVRAEADDLDGLRAALLRVRRSGVDDRKGVAGDQDEVGLVARLHRGESRVEHAHLVGLELHVVVAERDVGLGVHEDDPRRPHDPARGQPRREVGGDGEASEAGVGHDDRDVGLLADDLGKACRLFGARAEGRDGERGEDEGRRDEPGRLSHRHTRGA